MRSKKPAIACRVVAAAGQRLDAQAVGLGFVGARVVDLALLHQRPCAEVIAAMVASSEELPPRLLRGHDRGEHRQQDRDLVALGAFDRRAARAAG